MRPWSVMKGTGKVGVNSFVPSLMSNFIHTEFPTESLDYM